MNEIKRFPNKSAAAKRRWGNPLDRFWKNVNKLGPNDCWIWVGYKMNKDGYGGIRFNGKSWSAHRLSYLFANGEFDRSQEVCHHCDNPPCVNPNHLFLGSHQQNMIDMARKGRTGIKNGEENHFHRLSEETVKAIIKDRESGMSRFDLSRKHGIPEPTIGGIVTGRTWKHLGHIRKPYNPTDNRGEGNKASKLNNAIVRAIRAQHDTGLFSISQLAKMYRSTTTNIFHVIKRHTWRHVV